MMKKATALLLAVVMTLALLAGCGGNSGTTGGNAQNSGGSNTATDSQKPSDSGSGQDSAGRHQQSEGLRHLHRPPGRQRAPSTWCARAWRLCGTRRA